MGFKLGHISVVVCALLIVVAAFTVSCAKGRSGTSAFSGAHTGNSQPNGGQIKNVPLRDALSALDESMAAKSGDFFVYRLDSENRQIPSAGIIIAANAAGSGFEINIEADLLENSDDVYLYVRYNPDLYHPSRVEQGDFMPSGDCVFISVDEMPGWLAIGFASTRRGTEMNRTGTMATCRFDAGGKAPGRRSSKAPTGDSNKVTDLSSQVNDGAVTLSWTEVNKGDYDMSGEVGIPDITPIALNYLATVASGPGNPEYISWVDGDSSGEVGIPDITPIALNYLTTIAGYRVERAETSGFSVPVKLAGGSGNVSSLRNNTDPKVPTSYQITDEPGEGTWFYRVAPVSAQDEVGIFSSGVSANIGGPQGLLPPENVQASGGANFVNIQWTPSTNPEVTGYIVYYSQTSSAPSSIRHNVEPVTGDSYYLNDVNVGVNYYFWVKSTDGTLQSDFSNSATATLLPPDGDAPAAPAGLRWTRVGNDALIEWDLNTEDDVRGYDVYKSSSNNFAGASKVNSNFITETEFLATGITQDANWYFWVKATNYSGNESAESQSLLVRIDDLPPVAPVGLFGTPASTSVSLDWFDNLESDLAGYNVYVNTTNSLATANLANTGGIVTESQFTAASLDSETEYYFWVTALDYSQNESAASSPLQMTTLAPDATPPAVPTGLSASGRNVSVQLYWNENTEPDLLGYRVYVSTIINDPSPPLYMDGEIFTSAEALVAGLTNGTQYAFWVDAVDFEMNASPRSERALATPSQSGLAASAWPMFGFNERHAGRSPYTGSVTQGVRTPTWSSRPVNDEGSDTRMDLSFALAENGTIYAGGDSGWFFALSPEDGSIIWRTELATSLIDSSPAVGKDGTVYVGCNDNFLYAMEPISGAVKWSFDAGGTVHSSPVVTTSNVILVGSNDGFLYALNGSSPTGEMIWSYDTGGMVDFCSPAIGIDGRIYMAGGGTLESKLIKLSPSGQFLWEKPLGATTDSSPTIASNGDIYIGTSQPRIVCYNEAGDFRWEFIPDNLGSFNSPVMVGSNGTIFAMNSDAIIYAINPDTGGEIWSYSDASTYGTNSSGSPSIDASGNIYFCAGSTLVAIRTTTDPPQELWSYKMPGIATWSTPIIDGSGTVLVGCATSSGADTVYAFRD